MGVGLRPQPEAASDILGQFLTFIVPTPSGHCSTGNDILRQVTPDTPRWQPGAMHAGDFLEMLSGQLDSRCRQIA
jgi:hypothetical protein